MVGRTLGGATVAVFRGLVVFAVTRIAGFRPTSPLLLPVALVFMFLIGLLFTAVGTAIASTLEDFQGFQLIMNFLVMPLFFLPGALFRLQGLPGFLGAIVTLNPLSCGVDGLRATLIGTAHFGLLPDFAALGIGTAILLAIGSYLLPRIQV